MTCGTIESIIQGRSQYWYDLNYVQVRFTTDFVTGNVIDMNVSGVAIASTSFNTNQVTTMTDLIASINNTGVARASLVTADVANRTIQINGLLTTLVTVDGVVVTGGASQPVATVSSSRYSTLVNLARCNVGSALEACGKTNYGIALVIMHWLTLEANAGGSGNMQNGTLAKKQEGDLAIWYGSTLNTNASSGNNNSDAYWNQTAYGSEYLVLRRSCLIIPRNRIVGLGIV